MLNDARELSRFRFGGLSCRLFSKLFAVFGLVTVWTSVEGSKCPKCFGFVCFVSSCRCEEFWLCIDVCGGVEGNKIFM